MSTLDNDLNATARLGDLSVGDELPTIFKFPDEAQLFLYSAASHNPHRIHYDRDYARFEGYEDILVHGPLQGAWLTQYVTDWAGPQARLENVTWQNRASALAGEELVYSGTVTAVDAQSGVVELEIAEHTSDGRLLMPATARVRLPPDPD
ncbi:MaoC/PaaZ C-terminal domain-containing protein [Candidatus Poriferisodalis sp.]|uniref:MaoC/PaaZ C-terminal domain-containing protein n=1 Tax=Candidatus Poriferisodalis sp. TaxID=3101277 RepID=UPI003C705205